MSQADEEEPMLPPSEEAALLTALSAAWHPHELDPDVNERLIELALEDPLAPASADELAESARLRDALAAGSPHEAGDLLAALQASFTPHGASDAATERALAAALGPAKPAAKPKARRNVVYAVFGAAGAVLAAAAAVALVASNLTRGAPAPALADAAALVKPHSTSSLFAERFETGDTTARMDRIASARSRDLRDNRYAAWGVR